MSIYHKLVPMILAYAEPAARMSFCHAFPRLRGKCLCKLCKAHFRKTGEVQIFANRIQRTIDDLNDAVRFITEASKGAPD